MKFELHISDIRTFQQCRLLWHCQSPLRLHLEPGHTPWHFMTGRAVHYALARLYENGENPATVAHDYMHKAVEQEIAVSGPLWDEEKIKFQEQVDLATTICSNYVLWLQSLEDPDADWEVVATEIKYEHPLYTPSGRPSNRIFLAGRFDQIIRHRQTGNLWLREFKTSKRMPDEEWLEFDDQAAGYCWAASKIMGEPIIGIQYRFLLKKIPEQPKLVYHGTQLSRAINSNLSTTYELYKQAIKDHGFNELDYIDILQQLRVRGWQDYFVEIPVRKTQFELEHVAKKFWQQGLEMTRKNIAIYDEPEWNKCVRCSFKTPCKARKSGGNWMQILENAYRERIPEFELQDTIEYTGQEVKA